MASSSISKIIPFLFAAAFLFGHSFLFSNAKKQCGMSTFKGATIGKGVIEGQLMKDASKLPWMGTLFFSKSMFLCSVSIIGPRHILTAAHCFGDGKWTTENYQVVVGTVDYVGKHEMVNAKSIHKYADSYEEGDIAIIELEKELTFSENVQPLCLSANDQSAFNKLAVIAGWGVNNMTETMKIDSKLRFGQMQVLADQSACVMEGEVFFPERELCLSPTNSRARVCFGDSGSPLIVKLAGQQQWTQIGVTSRGIGKEECGPLDLVVYTRVSHFCDWIQKVTEGAVECGQ